MNIWRPPSGCAEYASGQEAVYLSRWTLLKFGRGGKYGKAYLHLFHRSDEGTDLHCHPWNFVSLVLWRGYTEITPTGARRKWPGMILLRPASWAHRVELEGGKKALTLVVTGPIVRTWGFHTPEGWIDFQTFFRKKGC